MRVSLMVLSALAMKKSRSLSLYSGHIRRPFFGLTAMVGRLSSVVSWYDADVLVASEWSFSPGVRWFLAGDRYSNSA